MIKLCNLINDIREGIDDIQLMPDSELHYEYVRDKLNQLEKTLVQQGEILKEIAKFLTWDDMEKWYE